MCPPPYLALLEGPVDHSENPLYGFLAELAHAATLGLEKSDEIIAIISQSILFEARSISADMTELKADLDFHNLHNSANPINLKQLRELQDMSKRNERQLAQEAHLRLGPVLGVPAPRPRAPGWPEAPRQEAGARAQGASARILGANQHQGRAGAAPAVAGAQRDIAMVMCFNCQTLGHYANQCPAARLGY